MVVYKDKENKEYKCELCYYGNENKTRQKRYPILNNDTRKRRK